MFRRPAMLAAATALSGAAVIGALLVTPSAGAATTGPAGDAFYNAPATVPSDPHGTLLSYRPTTVKLGQGAPAVNAWLIMYTTQDANGAPTVATGTVLVPTQRWDSGFLGARGPRPVIQYAPGTQGLANRCGFSRQLVTGTEYEIPNIVAALQRNAAVVVTDYQGFTNGGKPLYLVGKAQGQAVLDAGLAAQAVPNAGVAANAKTAIWGFSQGGQSAAWAGEIMSSYAPSLASRVVGVAAGGVPGDFTGSARYLDGGTGASFLLQGVIGLAQQYPQDIPLQTLASDVGKAEIAKASNQCVFESLQPYANKTLDEYTVGNQTLNQLLTTYPAIAARLKEQDLGTRRIPAPVFDYHGQADEFLGLEQAWNLAKSYCSRGTNVTFSLYPGEHITTQFQAAPEVLTWLQDRFDNKSVGAGSCGRLGAVPTSTANPPTAPNGSDQFLVSLDKWNLSGDLFVKGNLNQTINLPQGSTFDGDVELLNKTLNGALEVPPFKQNLNIVIIPTDIGIGIKGGPATGTVALDDKGNLRLRGNAKAKVVVQSLGLGFTIDTGCETKDFVDFPLTFDGPVSALGTGNLKFSGTATFPELTNCGLWAPLIGFFFSGPDNRFNFTVSPPAPRRI